MKLLFLNAVVRRILGRDSFDMAFNDCPSIIQAHRTFSDLFSKSIQNYNFEIFKQAMFHPLERVEHYLFLCIVPLDC